MTKTSRENPTTSAAALWLPVVGYMAFIFALSSISHPPAMPDGSDKLGHTLLYAGLGVVFARARAGGFRGVTVGVVLTTALFACLYGVSDEVHQYFNPPRNVEALDVLADTIGGSLGAIALYAWGIIRPRNGL
ncbi:MAG: VanZ family protein [Vicinamibacterales bacterium]